MLEPATRPPGEPPAWAPLPLPPPPRTGLGGEQVAAALVVLGILAALGSFAGGEVGTFMQAGLEVLPLTLVAVLAYLGRERQWARVAAIVTLALVAAGYALVCLLLGFAALLEPGSITLRPGGLVSLAAIVVGLGLAVMLGGLTALPGARRKLSRYLPLDPDSFVHAIALVLVVSLLLIGLVPLLVLAAPPLLTTISNASTRGQNPLGNESSVSLLREEFYLLVWTVPCAVLAVGWGIRRRLPATLRRLGLVRPTLRQVGAALGLAVLAVTAGQLLDMATSTLWPALGWPQTNNAALGQLFAFAMSPIGAVVVGISAGLGEEVAVRGVLQPRMGLLLSNLFFTSLHALQYNWDALLSVFLIGLLMGVVRQRSNTTTSAIVHGTYDCLLVLASVFGVPGF